MVENNEQLTFYKKIIFKYVYVNDEHYNNCYISCFEFK